ncbi:MAG: cell surface protein SprA, partial [Prevotellaceae bacterium]|nr:cell surface protein SprA [Prevotellaceae bacterium]
GGLSYSWTPVYKPFEPFKKIKNKSKYYDILKKFSLNWLPQNISFNTDMLRDYYELQERDLEDLGAENSIPVIFSSQFLWNRDFSIRWDLTKNLHLNFQSATHAEIEESYAPINKDLYPDQYTAWKDSVKQSISHMGTPLDYQQSFTASYKLPLNLIPIFNWVNADANYSSNYSWRRGAQPEEDGRFFGNTIAMNRQFTLNGTFNLDKLYDQVPFLKKTNERFKKSVKRVPKKQPKKTEEKSKDEVAKGDKAKDAKELAAEKKEREQKAKEEKKAEAEKKKQLAQNKNKFEREVTIKADTSTVLAHGKKSRSLIVTARDAFGKQIPVKYKVLDDNKIKVINKSDSIVTMKVTVVAKPKKDDLQWYRLAQSATRFLMMVRNVNFTYRNQYSMSLPGFRPNAGDMLGQNNTNTGDANALAPGLGFAFGFVDDDYIGKARNNNWLLSDPSVATPAATNMTEELSLKMTLEPARNLKVDLNASHIMSRAKNIQYMYESTPTTLSGSFTMTTVSIKSAFEGMGSAENGFRSASFENFCNSLEGFRSRVEAQYAGAIYPSGTMYEGQVFNPEIAGVNKYSADVMVPAFLSAYTGGDGLKIFPTLAKMLPNWSIRYSGLSNMTFFQNTFKSVNLNHSYKSIYAVGSYNSYSTYKEFMGDGLGFILDATGGSSVPVPNSMYNVSQVSINEAFSPLIGMDVTMKNNMTFKLEYRTTRVLSLSMTSVQLNETLSKDWVLGFGYKINDFSFSGRNKRLVKSKSKTNGGSDDDKSQNKSTSKSSKKSFNHDLNMRMDLSLRNQASITRDIASMTSAASSGNKAFKLSLSADYTLSKLLTLRFFYNSQSNTPLLTSSSYPTTTHDFGLSMNFSLTR